MPNARSILSWHLQTPATADSTLWCLVQPASSDRFCARILPGVTASTARSNGRSQAATPDKLDAAAVDTGADVEQIIADASDAEAMARLVADTRVVISTVGPYALYGSALVAAAAAAGTDYCDLTGEPQWMQKMIDAHGDTAAANGARIVHTCGFDSIPSDLGVWYTQQQAQEHLGTHCSKIAMRVKAMKGGASGGTIASAMNVMDEVSKDPALRKVLANPYAVGPGRHADRTQTTKRHHSHEQRSLGAMGRSVRDGLGEHPRRAAVARICWGGHGATTSSTTRR